MIDVQIKQINPKDDAYPRLMQYKRDADIIVFFENPYSGWLLSNYQHPSLKDERKRYS